MYVDAWTTSLIPYSRNVFVGLDLFFNNRLCLTLRPLKTHLPFFYTNLCEIAANIIDSFASNYRSCTYMSQTAKVKLWYEINYETQTYSKLQLGISILPYVWEVEKSLWFHRWHAWHALQLQVLTYIQGKQKQSLLFRVYQTLKRWQLSIQQYSTCEQL